MLLIFLFCSDLCTVDLRNDEGLSLQIENKNPVSYCEMSLNSVMQDKIVVPAGTKADLSFLDCPMQDLQLTATKVMGNYSSVIPVCHNVKNLLTQWKGKSLDLEKILCLIWLKLIR